MNSHEGVECNDRLWQSFWYSESHVWSLKPPVSRLTLSANWTATAHSEPVPWPTSTMVNSSKKRSRRSRSTSTIEHTYTWEKGSTTVTLPNIYWALKCPSHASCRSCGRVWHGASSLFSANSAVPDVWASKSDHSCLIALQLVAGQCRRKQSSTLQVFIHLLSTFSVTTHDSCHSFTIYSPVISLERHRKTLFLAASQDSLCYTVSLDMAHVDCGTQMGPSGGPVPGGRDKCIETAIAARQGST